MDITHFKDMADTNDQIIQVIDDEMSSFEDEDALGQKHAW